MCFQSASICVAGMKWSLCSLFWYCFLYFYKLHNMDIILITTMLYFHAVVVVVIFLLPPA
jgi:hypothetical protein